MGTLQRTLCVLVCTAWLLPGSANGIGRFASSSDKSAAPPIVASDPAQGFLAVAWAHLTRAAGVRVHPSEAGAPCPSSHPWHSADATKKSVLPQAEKGSTKSKRVAASEKVITQNATRRVATPAAASVSKNPAPSSSKSRTTAPIACTESCRAELDACQMPGAKRGKTNCKSMYDRCMQSC